MPFYNREKDIRRMKAVLSGEPNLVYFVYGPINSGKTALLMRVFDELSEEYRVFYINFRARHVGEFQDLLKVLFEVQFGGRRKKAREVVRELFKSGAKAVERFKGIPVPEKIFEYFFVDSRRVEDVFRYLEEVFEEIVRAGYRPVFVLDEMQAIKEVVNTAGRPVTKELFNFMVRLTKETHLCHCLCATSDCLFIEDVYNNARLEGRSKYLLVDDLDKEEAFRVYEGFGFEDKELVWDFIGGKVGDMVGLFEGKKQGYREREALSGMLRDEIGRIEWIKWKILRKRGDSEENWKFLRRFKEKKGLTKKEIEEGFDRLLFWIEQNILFYNPVEGTVRCQSRLIQRAIEKLF